MRIDCNEPVVSPLEGMTYFEKSFFDFRCCSGRADAKGSVVIFAEGKKQVE